MTALSELKERHKRETKMLLNELKTQLTESQLQFFNRIFRSGVPEEKLEMAIDLCDRTVRKNRIAEKGKND